MIYWFHIFILIICYLKELKGKKEMEGKKEGKIFWKLLWGNKAKGNAFIRYRQNNLNNT
jgi:hypothetical protein